MKFESVRVEKKPSLVASRRLYPPLCPVLCGNRNERAFEYMKNIFFPYPTAAVRVPLAEVIATNDNHIVVSRRERRPSGDCCRPRPDDRPRTRDQGGTKRQQSLSLVGDVQFEFGFGFQEEFGVLFDEVVRIPPL